MKQNMEHGKKRFLTISILVILALVFVFSIFSGMVSAECFKVSLNAEFSCNTKTNCGPWGGWVRGPGISLVWTKARLCDDHTHCDGSADLCTKCCCQNTGLCTVDSSSCTKVTHTSDTHISRWEYDFSFGFSSPTRQCEPIEYVWSEKDQVVDSDGYEIVEAELSSHIYPLYSLTHPVTVDSTISNAAFIVHWVGSDLNLVLYTPSGILVDPSVAKIDPDVYFEEAKNYEFYDIRRPEPGNWTMKVIAVDVPDVGENYTVRAFLMSNLTFTLSTDKYRYNSNEQVRIVANLRYNNTPLIGKTVTATIQRPDGIIDTTQLFDDGSHGDIKADDGRYSNIYTNTLLAGTYHIIASTSGTTPDNGFFFREKRKSIIVQALKAEFNDIYSDYGADTDDDGLYDCLTINVGVNIINPGNYSIKGQLSDKDGYEIVWADNAAYFDIGNNLLQLNFDGLQIRRHRVDAPFKLSYLVLSDATGTLIDYRYDAYTTSAYNYIDFQAPAVEFTDDYADYGTDIDGDGLYDYLTIDVGVNVIIPGNYSLMGWLYDVNGREIVWAVNDTYLNAGNNLVLLNFDGFQICRHGVNAPFKLGYLALSDVTGSLIDYRYDASTTLAYTYSEFQTPTIEFSRDYSDYGTDTDGDGLYEYLTVDVDVNITTAGNYSISGGLYEGNGTIITWAINSTYLDIGNQTVQLSFDGKTIYKHGMDGPYYLNYLGIYDETHKQIACVLDAYATSAYNYTDFQPPLAEFTGDYADHGIDFDDDGLYDYLTIDVGVNVMAAGNYSLMGYLYDVNGTEIVWSIDYGSLDVGTHSMHLDFNGKTIQMHGVNGPYYLRHLLLSSGENWTLIDYIPDAYNTTAYNYSDFVDPVSTENEVTISGVGLGEIRMIVSFTDTIPVFAGRYSYDLVGINVPQRPNNFTITTSEVKNLKVGVKKIQDNTTRIWVTQTIIAPEGIATVQSDLPSPGNYHVKIFGDAAEGASEVDLELTAVKKITASGDFSLSIDISGFPAGKYTVTATADTGCFTDLTLEDLPLTP